MATKYVSELGSGLKDGNSPENAYAVSSIVWGVGNTYYLLDTITSSITVGGSGASGSPIVIRGDYAGRTALLDGRGVTNNMIGFNVKSWIDIKNIAFANPLTGNGQLLYLDRGTNINVNGCSFTGDGVSTGRGIRTYTQAGTNGCNNILIDDNSFTDLIDAAFVITNYADQIAGVPHDITFSNNNVTNCKKAYQYIMKRAADTPAWQQVLAGLSLYSMDFDGNTVTGCEWAFIQLEWDASTVSYFRNNIITDTGNSTSEFNNCIQLENCKGGFVEGNIVDGHTKIADGGDGHAFIFDFVMDSADATYFTDSVTVRNNIFKGAKSAGGSNHCAGIKCYRGTNNLVYNNIVDDCLVGMSTSYNLCTGNVYYHNTCVNLLEDGYRSDQNSASAIVKNNIFTMTDASNSGMSWDLTGVAATESYNVVFNATTNTNVTLDSTDITTDPVIFSTYKTGSDSSARNLGAFISGYKTDIRGRSRDYPSTVGAYQVGSGDIADTRLQRVFT